MNYVLVTLDGGIIDQVLFFDDEADTIGALKKYVKVMDIDRNDAGVYGIDGLIVNAKYFLDE